MPQHGGTSAHIATQGRQELDQWCEMGDWMLLDSGLWGLGSPRWEMLAPRDQPPGIPMFV